jgi:hypothetical protein
LSQFTRMLIHWGIKNICSMCELIQRSQTYIYFNKLILTSCSISSLTKNISYTQQFRQNRSVLSHCISSTLYIVSCNIWTFDNAGLTLLRFKYILSLLLAEEFNPVFNCNLQTYNKLYSHMVKNLPKTSRHQCQELHYDFKNYDLAYGPKI